MLHCEGAKGHHEEPDAQLCLSESEDGAGEQEVAAHSSGFEQVRRAMAEEVLREKAVHR